MGVMNLDSAIVAFLHSSFRRLTLLLLLYGLLQPYQYRYNHAKLWCVYACVCVCEGSSAFGLRGQGNNKPKTNTMHAPFAPESTAAAILVATSSFFFFLLAWLLYLPYNPPTPHDIQLQIRFHTKRLWVASTFCTGMARTLIRQQVHPSIVVSRPRSFASLLSVHYIKR